MNGAACYVNLEPRLRDLLRRKCDLGLVSFLERRAAEVLPGGRVVLVFAGETGACDHQCSGPARAVQESIRALSDQGKLPREVKSEFFMKLVSWDDLRLRKIFARRPEWSIVNLAIHRVGCPHYKRLLGGTIDGQGFGFAVADEFLANAKVAPELQKALQSGSILSADEVDARRSAIREHAAQTAASNPWHYSTEGMVCFIQLERRHPLLVSLEPKLRSKFKLEAPTVMTLVAGSAAMVTAAVISTFVFSRRCCK